MFFSVLIICIYYIIIIHYLYFSICHSACEDADKDLINIYFLNRFNVPDFECKNYTVARASRACLPAKCGWMSRMMRCIFCFESVMSPFSVLTNIYVCRFISV